MFCPQCAKPNDESAKFCTGCGTSLSPAELTPAQVAEADRRHQEELYKAYIGPNNQYYYLSRFQAYDEAGKAGSSWHWPAFFITFYWLLYRKMWGLALLYYFVLYLLGLALSVATAGWEEGIAGIGSLIYMAAIFVLPPLYANALYYRRTKKKIAEVQAMTNDRQRQLGLLSGRGGTSWILLIIIGSFFFIAIIGILAAIALPAYADYTNRAQVTQALAIGRSAAVAVENYQHQHGSAPADLQDAGFNTQLPPSVTGIELDNASGTVVVGFKHPAIEGSLLIVPTQGANGNITWGCRSDDIANKVLPKECRSPE